MVTLIDVEERLTLSMWKETNTVLSKVIIATKHFHRFKVKLMLIPMRDFDLRLVKTLQEYI